jgi:hypothetical protein
MTNNFRLEITKEGETTTLTQPNGTFDDSMTRLNRLAHKYLAGNISPRSILISAPERTGVTIIPSDPVNAFMLNPSVAGTVRTFNVDGREQIDPDRRGAIAICPQLLGYSLMSRALDPDGEREFWQTMAHLIQAATLQFATEFGTEYVNRCSLVCERPGQPGVYFRDLDNAAAVELRFTLMR